MVPVTRDPADQLFHRQLPPTDPMTDANSAGVSPASRFELIPANYFAPLDLAQVFPRVAPLEIDLGCGDGAFLVAMAERFPERNFLGVERMPGRVRSACGRAARQGLSNVRVLRVESFYAVEYLFPHGSAAVAHLLFPDPWPKKRHQRRRIVTREFVAAVHRLLAPGGQFRVATDQADYFDSIRASLASAAFAEETPDEVDAFPLTTFEIHFRAQGAPIHRLLLRKAA
jgi:tRNA (guanine-N7-)-methyltransferase